MNQSSSANPREIDKKSAIFLAFHRGFYGDWKNRFQNQSRLFGPKIAILIGESMGKAISGFWSKKPEKIEKGRKRVFLPTKVLKNEATLLHAFHRRNYGNFIKKIVGQIDFYHGKMMKKWFCANLRVFAFLEFKSSSGSSQEQKNRPLLARQLTLFVTGISKNYPMKGGYPKQPQRLWMAMMGTGQGG